MKKVLYILRVLLFMTAIPAMIFALVWADKMSYGYTVNDRVFTNLSPQLRFVDPQDLDTLLTHYNFKFKQTPIRNFNWHELEDGLKTQTWIDSANVFIDAERNLHVVYRQRQPHVRIVEIDNPDGGYYLDAQGDRILLSEKFLVRVPVATLPLLQQNNIDKTVRMNLVAVSDAILRDTFWSAACTQLDVLPSGEIQMVPAIGNQIIRLGNADNIHDKLARLTLFYQQGYNTVPWKVYQEIDARFMGQIIGRNTQGKILSVDPYDPKAKKLLADSTTKLLPLQKIN